MVILSRKLNDSGSNKVGSDAKELNEAKGLTKNLDQTPVKVPLSYRIKKNEKVETETKKSGNDFLAPGRRNRGHNSMRKIRSQAVEKKTKMSISQAKLMGLLVKNNLTRDRFCYM